MLLRSQKKESRSLSESDALRWEAMRVRSCFFRVRNTKYKGIPLNLCQSTYKSEIIPDMYSRERGRPLYSCADGRKSQSIVVEGYMNIYKPDALHMVLSNSDTDHVLPLNINPASFSCLKIARESSLLCLCCSRTIYDRVGRSPLVLPIKSERYSAKWLQSQTRLYSAARPVIHCNSD